MDNGYQDCADCGGTGRVVDAAGAEVVCPTCEGFGILFDDTDEETGLGFLLPFVRLIFRGGG